MLQNQKNIVYNNIKINVVPLHLNKNIMKRFTNKLLATALLLTTILVFSSCEEEQYWVATTLDFETDVPVRGNGSFDYTIRVDESYFVDFRPNRETLLDVNTLNSWLTISNLLRDDRMSLRLVANGNIIYDYRGGTITPDKYGEFYIDDNGFKSFMVDAIDVIRRYGFVDITITGTSNIADGGPLVFLFENNVDIYVRD